MAAPVLSSWKEIAEYLGKGIRTVQRWEHELALPVHRPTENARMVIVNRAELDDWISQQRTTNKSLSAARVERREQLDRMKKLSAELLYQTSRMKVTIALFRRRSSAVPHAATVRTHL